MSDGHGRRDHHGDPLDGYMLAAMLLGSLVGFLTLFYTIPAVRDSGLYRLEHVLLLGLVSLAMAYVPRMKEAVR